MMLRLAFIYTGCSLAYFAYRLLTYEVETPVVSQPKFLLDQETYSKNISHVFRGPNGEQIIFYCRYSATQRQMTCAERQQK